MDTKALRVCIAGAAKNIIKDIDNSLKKLEEIKSIFHESSIIIIAEDHSSDGTKEYLKSQTNRIIYLDLDNKINVEDNRTTKLAQIRNSIMEYIHSNYSTYDYIILSDLDNVLSVLKPEHIQKYVFSFPNSDWDAIFPNALGKYYDIWALKSEALGISFDCWDYFNHLLQNEVAHHVAKYLAVKKYQTIIKPENKLIPVESAFGGLGIYKLSATRNCYYNGETNMCECKHLFKYDISSLPCRKDTCEHRSFHKDMIEKNGAKLFIHTNFFVCTQSEHL